MTSSAIASPCTCRGFARIGSAYLDGELDAPTLLEAEAHVAACARCREWVALNRAMRASLNRSAKVAAPEGLRARIATAMAAEHARERQRARTPHFSPSRGGERSRWWAVVPVAGAAAASLALWALRNNDATASRMSHRRLADNLVADLVAEHAHPLPPERTDPKDVRALEQYVGVPVQPKRFERAGARLVGGRVLPVHQERAAMLQYEIGTGAETHRMSVFIYDPRRIQVNGDELSPRSVGEAEVRVGRAQGYSIAVMQHGGIGYAVTADLDAEKSAQLAASFGQE